MVLKRDFEKDIVYHYCFGRLTTLPSVSPYSLKLECFMRRYNIKYENVFVVKERSEHGLLPFIELNGKQIADSQLIMEKLKTIHNIDEFQTPYDTAVHRAFQRMLEHHTFFLINKFKVIDKEDEIINLFLKENNITGLKKVVMVPIVKLKMIGKAKKRQAAALGNFSDEDMKMLLKKDLDTIRDFLGDKKYMAGDAITSSDCSVFGLLASTYYLPTENYVKQLMKVDYPTLVAHLERVKEELWKDDFEKKKEE